MAPRILRGAAAHDVQVHESSQTLSKPGPSSPPAAVASPLARCPYDLRHSALSTWLNAGVDATEVAERAGNSAEVLLSRYAKCLDGRQEVANRRIEDLLREYE